MNKKNIPITFGPNSAISHFTQKIDIDEKYLEIIKKCKFISKPDCWFVEGSECILENEFTYPDYTSISKFNQVNGLFSGMTMETYKGYSGKLPRADEETCPFDEFFIYDEFGNDISELTLGEYKSLIRDNKINQIIK